MAEKTFAERVVEIRDQYLQRVDNINSMKETKKALDQRIKEATREAENAKIEAYAHLTQIEKIGTDRNMPLIEKERLLDQERASAEEWNKISLALGTELKELKESSERVNTYLRSAIAVNYRRTEAMNEMNEEHTKKEHPVRNGLSQLWRSTIFYRAFKRLQEARLGIQESMTSIRETMIDADARTSQMDAEKKIETDATYDKVAAIVNDQDKLEPAKIMQIANECAETGQNIAVNIEDKDGNKDEAEFSYDQTDDGKDPKSPGTSGVVTITMQKDGTIVAKMDTTTKNVECPEGMHYIKTASGRRFFVDSESLEALQELTDEKSLTPIDPARRKERAEEQEAEAQKAGEKKTATEIVKNSEAKKNQFHLLEAGMTHENVKKNIVQPEAEVETTEPEASKYEPQQATEKGMEENDLEQNGHEQGEDALARAAREAGERQSARFANNTQDAPIQTSAEEAVNNTSEQPSRAANSTKNDAAQTQVAETQSTPERPKEIKTVEATRVTAILRTGEEVDFYCNDKNAGFVQNAIRGTFKDKAIVQEIHVGKDKCQENELVENRTGKLKQLRDVVRYDLAEAVPNEALAPRAFNTAEQHRTALLQQHELQWKEAKAKGQDDIAERIMESANKVEKAYAIASKESEKSDRLFTFVEEIEKIINSTDGEYATNAMRSVMSEQRENGTAYINKFLDYGFNYNGQGGDDKDNRRMTNIICNVTNANASLYYCNDTQVPLSEMANGRMTDHKVCTEKQILENIENVMSDGEYLYDTTTGQQLAFSSDEPWLANSLADTRFVIEAARENHADRREIDFFKNEIRKETDYVNGEREVYVDRSALVANEYQLTQMQNIIQIDSNGTLGAPMVADDFQDDRIAPYQKLVHSDGTEWNIGDINRNFIRNRGALDTAKEQEAEDITLIIKDAPLGRGSGEPVVMTADQIRMHADSIASKDTGNNLEWVNNDVNHQIMHEDGTPWNIGEINGSFIAKTDRANEREASQISVAENEDREAESPSWDFQAMKEAAAREEEGIDLT